MSDPLLWGTALGVLGAVFGSFIATVAVRWPEPAWTGRSRCDGCRRTLTPVELVPILSWMALRGRCRTCGVRIGPLHVAIETIGAIIGMTAAIVSQDGATAVSGAGFGWLLLLAGAIDFVAFRLPNLVTLAIAMCGAATGFVGLAPSLVDRLVGGGAGFAALWATATLYRRLRGRTGLGGGDAKLFGAIGLWLGWRALPPTVLIACVIGLAWASGGRLRGDDRLPFGTLLAVGAFGMWIVSELS